MCVEPTFLQDGQKVACRYCWQCIENRTNDLVGRCIAESHTSDATLSVTLTYAKTDERTAVLHYGDFQQFIKRLRYHGYKVRYLVAGEYGSRKGRAHWHAVLFFTGKIPDEPEETRINWKYWPHGYSYFQAGHSYSAIRYAVKYALKDQKQKVFVNHLAMSKKPPLGHDFFIGLAQDHVRAHLSPQNPSYSFRDVFDGKQKRRKFWLYGRMREIYSEHFIETYRDAYGKDHPFSDFLGDPRPWKGERFFKPDPDHWEQVRQEFERKERERIERNKQQHQQHNPTGSKGYFAPRVGKYLAVKLNNGTVDLRHGKDQSWHVETKEQLETAVRQLGAIPVELEQLSGWSDLPSTMDRL